jgi:O-acetyl-ADP-ribose deacetylase (regulator of RNase III)
MIQFIKGDIFNSNAQCLINPVNCVGVMGKGLALEFKQRFPEMYQFYKLQCANGLLHIGQIAFYGYKVEQFPIICLFPTKRHWKEPSTLEILETSLRAFIKYAPEMKIATVAFPKIGSGLGGLNFDLHVLPLMELYLTNSPFNVEIYL